LHIYEQTVKGFVYSVKLKLEFSILGKLVDIVQENKRNLAHVLGDVETCIESPKSSPILQHTENRADTSPDISVVATPNGSVSGPVRLSSQDSISFQARRRGARDSVIDYAEIVRSMS
jgi:hypothetical protein